MPTVVGKYKRTKGSNNIKVSVPLISCMPTIQQRQLLGLIDCNKSYSSLFKLTVDIGTHTGALLAIKTFTHTG